MIGVVDPDARLPPVADALEHPIVADTAGEVVASEASPIVAVGTQAVSNLIDAGVDAPILPIDAGQGFGNLSIDSGIPAARCVANGEYTVIQHPLLSVRVGEQPVGQGIYDAMLVRAETARISDYAIDAPDHLARFRADGVLIATPAGSYGYARAAGGPLVTQGTEAVAVVPVGAFAIRIDHWIIDAGTPITVSVERNEGEVELLLDGRTTQTVAPNTPVIIGTGSQIDVIELTAELEKL